VVLLELEVWVPGFAAEVPLAECVAAAERWCTAQSPTPRSPLPLRPDLSARRSRRMASRRDYMTFILLYIYILL
jgi:hypothetical protein